MKVVGIKFAWSYNHSFFQTSDHGAQYVLTFYRTSQMHRTLIIRREYLHFVPKYSRYEKRHTNLAAHVSPAFRVEDGDQVTVGQCRPLSKTVRFNVLRVLPRTGKAVKKFQKF